MHFLSPVLTSSAVWRAERTIGLTGHTCHPHFPSPISAGFNAPSVCETLTFGLPALAASIARTSTLRDVSPERLVWLGDHALAEVEWLLENMPTFRLSQDINALADAERTAFAGRIGAGVTDLTMNALGYTWRDNAACISSAHSPHPDFIYGGDRVENHGVVLAEAHGSFARTVSGGTISGQAKRKYCRQVKPHLAAESPHGRIVHGYSIAFGSKPGASGAFLHVAETEIPTPGTERSPDTEPPAGSGQERPPISLALATHRANFSLMGAPSVVTWIDWVRAGGERPDVASPLIFLGNSLRGSNFSRQPGGFVAV